MKQKIVLRETLNPMRVRGGLIGLVIRGSGLLLKK